MELISVYETSLYYCCLLLIARSIFECTANKRRLFSSFVLLVPLVFLALTNNTDLYNISYVVFLFIQFILIKLIYADIKLKHIVFSYLLLYCTNASIIIVLSVLIPAYPLYTDAITHTVTTILVVIICSTGMREKVRQVINWTPTYVLAITSLSLLSVMIVSVLIIGSSIVTHKDIWNNYINIALIVLQFSTYVILSGLLLSAISNSQLKNLTANYEQQIRTQAEHYKTLAAANFETRRFKHDFKNISIGIEKLLADGNYDQALNYLRTYNHDLNAPGAFCPAFDTGNGIADALLTDKQEKASACNTIIVFHGAIPMELLSPTDLCVVLGNSLDNAIEACQKLPSETVKTISLDCTCNSGFLFLSVSNPVDHKVVIRDNYVATTKENKTLHGFGLYSLHSVVKKYNGNIRLASTDTSFTINIDLCMISSQTTENSLPL